MKVKKVLHISQDNKFIDYFIETFKTFEKIENNYVVVLEQGFDVRFVKSKEVNVFFRLSSDFKKKISDLSQYDAIFIHYLTPFLAHEIVLKAPKNIQIFIFFFGAEIFNLEPFFKQSLQPLSRKFFRRNKIQGFLKTKNLLSSIQTEFLSARKKKIDKGLMLDALRRSDFFCHWIEDDFTKIKELFNLKLKFINFIYGDVEFVTGSFFSKPIKPKQGENILIGNSANITNNHLDIFESLKKFSFLGRKIYVPLSYSKYSISYVDEVVQNGKQMFGKNFIPLLNFVDVETYNSIIDSCGIVFMNHLRSQAGGNVIFSLYTGKKVFMSKKSNMYVFLKNLGLTIFNVDDFNSKKNHLFIELTFEEKINNRDLVLKYFSKNKSIENLNKISKKIHGIAEI